MNYKASLLALSIVAASLLLAINCNAAKQQQQVNGLATAGSNQGAIEQQASASHSKSWLPHAKSRSSRSLSDMFEKVKSKIFGSKKSSSSPTSSASSAQSQSAPSASSQSLVLSQLQPSASSNNLALQRQPWDVNTFNQQQFGQFGGQVSPASQYQQWPASSSQISASNPFGLSAANQAAFANQMSYSPAGQPSYSASLVPNSVGMDTLQASASNQQTQQAGASAPGPAGILSSASHLISQYLSPAGANQQQQQQQQSAIPQQQQQAQSLLSPNQQSQYNEFASMLDSMVAQTGLSPPMQQQQQQQRQPNNFLNGQPSQSGSNNQNMYSQASQLNGNMMSGDNEMMSSNNVQILAQPGSPAGSSPVSVGSSAIAPSASSSSGSMQTQASGKSNMVSLAEQLAPGAQFNKLISFPFSLSNNDDPNKEGRFKLHIPFLNQHVKRSDHHQQQQQKQQQQLLSQQQSYYNQQQYVPLLSNSNNNVQAQPMSSQMLGQASQPVASIVSPPQSPVSNILPSHSQVSPSSSIIQTPSQSQSVSVSSSSSSSSSAISQQSPNVSSTQQ